MLTDLCLVSVGVHFVVHGAKGKATFAQSGFHQPNSLRRVTPNAANPTGDTLCGIELREFHTGIRRNGSKVAAAAHTAYHEERHKKEDCEQQGFPNTGRQVSESHTLL
ncbi:MAG: hypothetical protein OHK0029_11570 [Armatimonadaceae bacterium]